MQVPFSFAEGKNRAIFPRFWPFFSQKTLFLGRFACANLSDLF
jgi:hypothetical protein